MQHFLQTYFGKNLNPDMSFLKNPIRYRWLMLGIMGVIYFLACLHRISPTVIARDLVNEFGADATALGLMASSYFYLYAAVQPPVGILSDTIGPRRVVTIFTLIACLGCLVFGLAPSMLMAGVGRGSDRHRGRRHFRARIEDLLRLV